MTWNKKLKEWLIREEDILTDAGHTVRVFSFNYIDSDEETMSDWAKHFRNHYCSDEIIDDLKRGTGLSRKDYLLNIKFPDQTGTPGPSVRAGDFSEILISDYLEYILNYWVPRTRYFNKNNKNSSPMGTDVIGFRLFNSNETAKDTLAIIEAKSAYSRTDKNRLQNAIDDSQKDVKRIAESLNAMKHRYLEANNIENANKIERFQNYADKPYKKIYGAAALFSTDFYNEELIRNSDVSKHTDSNNLILIVIKGDNMMALVHELYRRAADEA